MLVKNILNIEKTKMLLEDNFLGADDASEAILREEFSNMLIRIIMQGADRHYWDDPTMRVHVLAIVLNILRLDYKNKDHQTDIAKFIAIHKLGTIDFLQELDELGLDFSHADKLIIIHALGGDDDGRDINIFLDRFTELYDAGLYNLEPKESTDALIQFIKWFEDKYQVHIDDCVKEYVMEMYCTNNNPNFKLFGRVIKRLFKNNGMDKMKQMFENICKRNCKDFFGDMEGTFQDMKAQVQLNDEDTEYIRQLIHKNTTLNKVGQVARNKKKEKNNKRQKIGNDKLHMFRSSGKQLHNNKDSDTESSNSNKSEDSFIDEESESEDDDDCSYDDNSANSANSSNDSDHDDEKLIDILKRKRNKKK
jgi:hypothetical protein